jgi:GntR family transcriptional regulator
MIERAGAEPLYRQIAEEVRGKIHSGELAVGEQLPIEAEMQHQYGVARNVVRAALGVLRDEGLVATTSGRGSFVLPREERKVPYAPTLIRSEERVMGEPGFVTQMQRLGLAGQATLTVVQGSASREVAELLGIEEGDAVVHRQEIQTVEQIPSAIVTSTFPLELIEGTPIALPEDCLRGTDTVLADIGLEAVRRRDRITARRPTEAEATALGLGPDAIILLVVASKITAANQVVALFRRVSPADRTILIYDSGA